MASRKWLSSKTHDHTACDTRIETWYSSRQSSECFRGRSSLCQSCQTETTWFTTKKTWRSSSSVGSSLQCSTNGRIGNKWDDEFPSYSDKTEGWSAWHELVGRWSIDSSAKRSESAVARSSRTVDGRGTTKSITWPAQWHTRRSIRWRWIRRGWNFRAIDSLMHRKDWMIFKEDTDELLVFAFISLAFRVSFFLFFLVRRCIVHIYIYIERGRDGRTGIEDDDKKEEKKTRNVCLWRKGQRNCINI